MIKVITKKITSVGESVKNQSPHTQLVRMKDGTTTLEGGLAVPQKMKHTVTI